MFHNATDSIHPPLIITEIVEQKNMTFTGHVIRMRGGGKKSI